jgi:hypothetical protein
LSVLAQQEADRVIRLPGLPEVTFKQYAVMEELCFIGFLKPLKILKKNLCFYGSMEVINFLKLIYI